MRSYRGDCCVRALVVGAAAVACAAADVARPRARVLVRSAAVPRRCSGVAREWRYGGERRRAAAVGMLLTTLPSGARVLRRYCRFCERFLRPRRSYVSPSTYAKRIYCSQICASRASRQPVAPRFWSKVKKTRRCWWWRGVVGRDGYGHFHVSTKRPDVGAHRVSWWLTHGVWPAFALHRCNHKKCVRPSHLYSGTRRDNAADRIAAGTQPHLRGSLNGMAKLTAKQCDEIRRYCARHPRGAQWEMVREFGVAKSTVSRIVRGVRFVCFFVQH